MSSLTARDTVIYLIIKVLTLLK